MERGGEDRGDGELGKWIVESINMQLFRVIGGNGKLMSVCTKLVQQIVAKLGGVPWGIGISLCVVCVRVAFRVRVCAYVR
jgi:hypothetical protein